MVNFPAPVGGTVLPPDFAPSVLFAVLYGLLLPLLAYRMLDRRSRCTLLIGTMAFSVERCVVDVCRLDPYLTRMIMVVQNSHIFSSSRSSPQREASVLIRTYHLPTSQLRPRLHWHRERHG